MSLSPKSENLLSPVRMEWKNIRRLLIEAGLNRSEITELKKCYMLRAAAAEADAILPRRCIEVKLPSAQRRDAQQSVSACAEQSNILRENQLQALQDAFRRYSGAELVFNKAGLPGQGYFEKLPPLVLENRVRAAQIALREVRMYPPGYLDGIGLKTIGIFDACVSETNDGYHQYSSDYGGFLYYGCWNGQDGICAAYYSNEQLPLTLHHEIFHHADGTKRGQTDVQRHFNSDDRTFTQVVSGQARYTPPQISPADLLALQKRSSGSVLSSAVGAYTGKSSGEDQAETARYLMSHLADALVQIIEQPHLPGSQRMMHVMHELGQAAPSGPAFSWWVDKALGRAGETPDSAAPQAGPQADADLAAQLRAFAGRQQWRPEDFLQAREILENTAASASGSRALKAAPALVRQAASLTYELAVQRIKPAQYDGSWVIWGGESVPGGPNLTLQRDIRQIAADAARLNDILKLAPGEREAVQKTRHALLQLVQSYRGFIESEFSLSTETAQVFAEAERSLGADDGARELLSASKPAYEPRRSAPPVRTNPHMRKVDRAIEFAQGYEDDERRVERNIRAVQPACVWVNGASGVNLSADGAVLTNAHVADNLHAWMKVSFPDGSEYWGQCTAIDHNRDLAIIKLHNVQSALPYAPLASNKPGAGTPVVCIGQPDPSAGYENWHVSVGKIHENKRTHPWRGLGGVAHTAWTYWGNSGSPLFNYDGEIVALHNTWDSTTALRHAVPQDQIAAFLQWAGLHQLHVHRGETTG